MTENRQGKKTTFTELSEYMFGFCMQKIIRDKGKSDPLSADIDYLKNRCDGERDERLKAYRRWQMNRTEKNAVACLAEFADEINFLLFQAGQIAGFTEMERR